MDYSALEEIGLNKSEIKVYFALLELETSTVGPIIKKAKITHSKIYITLNQLQEKGLANYVIKNKVKHYQAANPKTLLRILEEKQEQLNKQKKTLQEQIIPNIELRKKLTKEKQEATVYETLKGINSAFDYLLNTLQKNEEYQVLMLGEDLTNKQVIRFFQNYHKRRIEKNISVRLISQNKFKQIIQKKHTYPLMQTKYSNKQLPVGTFIFKNHVLTLVWSERPTAFIVKSEKNYEHYKKFFEEVWSTV